MLDARVRRFREMFVYQQGFGFAQAFADQLLDKTITSETGERDAGKTVIEERRQERQE